MAKTLQRYVASLRAINVGGRTVKMERLRAEFEALGYAEVATFIASGNVIFRAAKEAALLEEEIEGRLQQALGYPVGAFVRTMDEVAAIARYAPFTIDPSTAGGTLMIIFLRRAPTKAAREQILSCRTATDDFHVHGREVYWRLPTGLMDSTVSGALLEKSAGMPATTRNVTTVQRLAAKYA